MTGGNQDKDSRPQKCNEQNDGQNGNEHAESIVVPPEVYAPAICGKPPALSILPIAAPGVRGARRKTTGIPDRGPRKSDGRTS
jgi:hypothetical protein